MKRLQILRSALAGGASVLALIHPVEAKVFDIPNGDLSATLGAYVQQSNAQIIYIKDVVHGHQSRGARGNYTEIAALTQLLRGTGFTTTATSSNAIEIVPAPKKQEIRLAAAIPAKSTGGGTIETVTVTAEKMSEDIQTVPIAVTAVTQKEMTINQIAGGPDLIKSVPNLTFSKTNFSGYNLEIRGIGTQAISVTTDPAVAVALNGIPFIRNHFFEQEFYDLSSAEILRGPQGTLYGRNATAGVVNILTAKPTDEFAAMASVDFGNYDNRRYEAMVNMPIIDDRLDIRVAGEWTKRDGYSTNTDNNSPIDGRDLWSSRVTIGWKPTSDIQTYLVWEHFSEDDNRMRTAKQLCQTDPGLSQIDGVPLPPARESVFVLTSANFSQGCLPSSLYSKNSFQVPNGFSLPFISGAAFERLINGTIDPYASTTQSTNLRDIQSAINPIYRAKNDTVEFNAEWTIDPTLTFSSQTGYNSDFLWSSEDYNRFDTSPGIFIGADAKPGAVSPTGVFCDPQLGCSDRLVLQDLSTEHAWQFSQEVRLASSFSGPLNFTAGANLLHYETEENYYVFANTFTLIALNNVGCDRVYVPNVTNDLYCLDNGRSYVNPATNNSVPTESPQYIDPNPITSLDNAGHNYFVSQNPYTLNSYAVFGEVYYNVTDDLKLTGGLRWTDDRKHFVDIPSELLTFGYGYPITGTVNQSWSEFTGRFAANWSPKLDFTDQSMFYASYAHGYKAGGANPPGAVLLNADTGGGINSNFPTHPLTFKPEFIDAFELGSKNTVLDDTLTLNADIFYYKYKNYQISQIVDRSAINLNFDASVKGAELESTWEPLPGLRFTFAGGYETSALANGSQAVDLIDRTAGNPAWVVMKPSVGQASNCVFPAYVAAALIQEWGGDGEGNPGTAACGAAYVGHLDPVTLLPYVPNPTIVQGGSLITPVGYPGFDPSTAPNNGQGFAKDLSGNQLPNAPHFTASFTAQYTMPVSASWAATLHGDFYWQANSWARVENDRPYDVIHGYSTTNLALILNDTTGWQIQAYVKNLFNVTAITGDFLNSDDSGLTTNVFLTDPRLFGFRVTKQLEGADVADEGLDFLPAFFSDRDGGRPPLWIELGGQMSVLNVGQQAYEPPFVALIPNTLPSPLPPQKPSGIGLDYEGKVSFEPADTDWMLSAGVRYGRSESSRHVHHSSPLGKLVNPTYGGNVFSGTFTAAGARFLDETTRESETHLIVDFTAGKDVGLGMFGGTSVLSGGIRIAQFTSRAMVEINSDPIYHQFKYHDVFDGKAQERRSFHGIGPSISWSGAQPIFGDVQNGELDIDWGASGAVLFGRQRVNLHHETSQCQVVGGGSLATCPAVYSHAGTIKRSRFVTVPNLGGFGGVSVRYVNAKVSFGYRVDEFFGAMDGGEGVGKSFNRGFFGPYANISIGLGG